MALAMVDSRAATKIGDSGLLLSLPKCAAVVIIFEPAHLALAKVHLSTGEEKAGTVQVNAGEPVDGASDRKTLAARQKNSNPARREDLPLVARLVKA